MTDSGVTKLDPIRVLICDDSDVLRLLLRRVIEREPDLEAVGEARNGQEAIEEARRLQPDVILLDLSMPVLSGLDALPGIAVAASGARVIVLTGLAASVVERLVLDAGASAFLEKGASVEQIAAAIRVVHVTGRQNGTSPQNAGIRAVADPQV